MFEFFNLLKPTDLPNLPNLLTSFIDLSVEIAVARTVVQKQIPAFNVDNLTGSLAGA